MIKLGKEYIKIEDINAALYENESVEITKETSGKVKDCHEFLKAFANDKLIYGINTGFGPMAQYKISPDKLKELQYNLIRSHCTGMGKVLDEKEIKASMICRLNSLLQSRSGVHSEVTELLSELINKGVYPKIFESGGVGASGDLVQLAHIALILIGEGEVIYKGNIIPTAEAFNKEGLTPIKMHIREGLALLNGTSVMTGIAAINLIDSKKLLNWSLSASAILLEIVESYGDYFSDPLNRVKPHLGQNKVAQSIGEFLEGSGRIRQREKNLYKENGGTEDILEQKVQEYYSLRCVPQITGPIYDTLVNAKTVVESEMNSVNDNPIIDYEEGNIFHGGNFHGDYISLEMDKVKIVMTKLSMLAERQLNFLLNDKLNKILPPFVNLETLGLNLGMQAAQFTATSSTAENQTLSNSMYVHSIPCNNDNQDIVSMGTNSGLLCKKVIGNCYNVLSIEWITILQAIDYLDIVDDLSPKSKAIYKELRQVVPVINDENPMYDSLEKMKNHLQNNTKEFI